MAISSTKNKQGFVLLVAVIFMSVMLSFALTLGSLSYKQHVLTGAAIDSQYAFYAADSGLECALYADQKLNSFEYATHSGSTPPALVSCGGVTAVRQGSVYKDASVLIDVQRISFDAGKRCTDMTVYKYATGASTLFAQGYNVPCATVADPGNARLVSRGVKASY
jgi:hypothetical protein